jgi:hypothetical protein
MHQGGGKRMVIKGIYPKHDVFYQNTMFLTIPSKNTIFPSRHYKLLGSGPLGI